MYPGSWYRNRGKVWGFYRIMSTSLKRNIKRAVIPFSSKPQVVGWAWNKGHEGCRRRGSVSPRAGCEEPRSALKRQACHRSYIALRLPFLRSAEVSTAQGTRRESRWDVTCGPCISISRVAQIRSRFATSILEHGHATISSSIRRP